MREKCLWRKRSMRRFWAVTAAMILGISNLPAQVAITEVMSQPMTIFIGGLPVRQSDWWELRNFGLTPVHLNGWHFTDNRPTPKVFGCFQGLVIQPGESIVFFRANNTPDEAGFRAWWGECLRAGVRVIPYPSPSDPSEPTPGFAETGDGLRLYDEQGTLVDAVNFGVARDGTTFVSHPETGRFGDFSRLGECGVCRSATAENDIGSPGATCDPISLTVQEHPDSIEVNAGSDATFCVTAIGLPRPKYQWFFHAEPGLPTNWIPIPGARDACYAINDVQPIHAGQYRVEITNGLQSITSNPAALTVNTNPSPPVLGAWFTPGDVIHLPSFAEQLRNATNKVSEFVFSKLAEDTRQALEAYAGQGIETNLLNGLLVRDMNAIIGGESIYEPGGFSNIALRSAVLDLLAENPDGADLARLNRLLLEDAYPVEIAKKARTSKDNAPHEYELFAELSEFELFETETAVFRVSVRGYPRIQFQWQVDGVDIPGATNRVFTLPNVNLGASGAVYQVNIWNEHGSTNAAARMSVNPWPTLRITELMPDPPPSSPHENYAVWWELTNLGDQAVRLKKFRHTDQLSLTRANVIRENIQIQPGESVIFVEQLTRQEFVQWWGAENLPLRLQVITFTGYGLNDWSDQLYLFSAAAQEGTELPRPLASVSYASATPFPFPPTCPGGCSPAADGQLLTGRSLYFDTESECAYFGSCSEENESGAFLAASCNCLGSPGFHVLPKAFGLEMAIGNTAMSLKWRVVKGKQYQLDWRPNLEDLGSGGWIADAVTHTAQGATLTINNPLSPGDNQRFYRLRELP